MKKLLAMMGFLIVLYFSKPVFAQQINGVYRMHNYYMMQTITLKLSNDTFTFQSGYGEGILIEGRISRLSDSVYSFWVTGDTAQGRLIFTHQYKQLFLTDIPLRVQDSTNLFSVVSLYRESAYSEDNKKAWEMTMLKFSILTGEPGVSLILEYNKKDECLSRTGYYRFKKDGRQSNFYTAAEGNTWGGYKSQGRWKQGLMQGKWRYYNTSGILVRKERYKKGKMVSAKNMANQ